MTTSNKECAGQCKYHIQKVTEHNKYFECALHHKRKQVHAIKQLLLDFSKPTLDQVAPNLYTLNRKPVLSKQYKPSRAPRFPHIVNCEVNGLNVGTLSRKIQEFIANPNPECKIQHYKIDDTDTRVALRGSYGVSATAPIKKHEVLVEYIGELATMKKLEQEYDYNLITWCLIQRYLGTFNTHDNEIDPNTEITISAYGQGNIACLINDCRKYPWKPLTHRNTYKKKNVSLIEYQTEFEGIMRMFVVAISNINEGDEILLDYGTSYWDNNKGDEAMLSVVHKLAESTSSLGAGFVENFPINIDL